MRHKGIGGQLSMDFSPCLIVSHGKSITHFVSLPWLLDPVPLLCTYADKVGFHDTSTPDMATYLMPQLQCIAAFDLVRQQQYSAWFARATTDSRHGVRKLHLRQETASVHTMHEANVITTYNQKLFDLFQGCLAGLCEGS